MSSAFMQAVSSPTVQETASCLGCFQETMNTQYSIFPAILMIVLFIAVWTDLKWRRIFNWLTFPTILTGIALHSVATGYQGLCFAGAGIGVACLALALFLFSGAI